MKDSTILGDGLHEKDNLLDGFSFEDLITVIHCNEAIISEATVERVVNEILTANLEDMRFLLRNNMAEIIKRANEKSA